MEVPLYKKETKYLLKTNRSSIINIKLGMHVCIPICIICQIKNIYKLL